MRMTKKEIIEKIKSHALSNCNETILFRHKGETQAAMVIPRKESDETWRNYLEQFEIYKREENSWLLVVNFNYGGSLNILFDWFGEI